MGNKLIAALTLYLAITGFAFADKRCWCKAVANNDVELKDYGPIETYKTLESASGKCAAKCEALIRADGGIKSSIHDHPYWCEKTLAIQPNLQTTPEFELQLRAQTRVGAKGTKTGLNIFYPDKCNRQCPGILGAHNIKNANFPTLITSSNQLPGLDIERHVVTEHFLPIETKTSLNISSCPLTFINTYECVYRDSSVKLVDNCYGLNRSLNPQIVGSTPANACPKDMNISIDSVRLPLYKKISHWQDGSGWTRTYLFDVNFDGCFPSGAGRLSNPLKAEKLNELYIPSEKRKLPEIIKTK